MKILSKLIIIGLVVVCSQVDVKGQDASDFAGTVLQLSNTFPGGSA